VNKAFDNQIRREHRVEFLSVFNIEITKETKSFILKKKTTKKRRNIAFLFKITSKHQVFRGKQKN
jgi:hypothetical protein